MSHALPEEPEEEVLCLCQPHWVVFLRPAAATVLALCFQSLPLIAVPLALFAVASAVFAFLFWRASEYTLLPSAIRAHWGWLRPRTLEMTLDQVESVEVRQSLLGQLMDYGEIVFLSTEGMSQRLPLVPDPKLFEQTVLAHLRPQNPRTT